MPDRHNLRKLKVVETPSGVIVSNDHPLAGRPNVPLSECINYPFILPDFSIAARRLIDSALGASGVQTVPSLVTNSTGLMKRLIADNRHIAFLNAGNLMDLQRDAGLEFIPLAGRLLAPEELSLIARSSQGLSSATSAVVDLIKAQMDSLPIAPKSA